MKLRDKLTRDFRSSDENEKILSAYDKILQTEFEEKSIAPAKDAERIVEARQLSVPEKHQLKIAKKTLKMSDAGAKIMGGMSKKEAVDFLKKIGYSDAKIKKMSEETDEQSEVRSIQEAYENSILNPRIDEGEVDKEAAKELYLYVDNDSNLHRQMVQPWQKNLITKIARGQFKYDMAIKGLANNLFTEGAKRYAKEFSGGSDWSSMFSTATRKEAAKMWLDYFLTEAEMGNYDGMLPKKYQADGTKSIDYKKLKK